MAKEPPIRQGPRAKDSPRWRDWYSFIADWLIRNPGGNLEDCAKALNKNVYTIRFIVRSDLFRDYMARRKEEWHRNHDMAILQRTTRVAEAALDLMLEKIEKQGDKIPMNLITDVATSALDRLGYAPQSRPQVEVNVDNRKVVMVPISAEALTEARDAIRSAEDIRAILHREKEVEPALLPQESGKATDPASDRFQDQGSTSAPHDPLDDLDL